jgi:hypothetical protein
VRDQVSETVASQWRKPHFQGFPSSGRSRTRTWDLFLIREAL